VGHKRSSLPSFSSKVDGHATKHCPATDHRQPHKPAGSLVARAYLPLISSCVVQASPVRVFLALMPQEKGLGREGQHDHITRGWRKLRLKGDGVCHGEVGRASEVTTGTHPLRRLKWQEMAAGL